MGVGPESTAYSPASTCCQGILGAQAEQTQGADPKPQEPQDRALGGAGGAGVGAEQGQALGGVVAPPGLLGPHALLSQARNLAPEGRGLG